MKLKFFKDLRGKWFDFLLGITSLSLMSNILNSEIFAFKEKWEYNQDF